MHFSKDCVLDWGFLIKKAAGAQKVMCLQPRQKEHN